MAVEIPGTQLSFEAGGDLHLKQYHFVKLASGKVVICNAATDDPIGILQNTPTSGQMATVMVMGVSKVSCHESCAVDLFVGTADSGQSAPYVHGVDVTKYIVGQMLIGATDVDHIGSVAFNCLGVGRAA